MNFVIPLWVKIALLVIGIIVFLAIAIVLYLLVAGADQSRRNIINKEEKRKE